MKSIRKELLAQRDAALVDDYKEGLPIEDLCAKYALANSRVLKIIQQAKAEGKVEARNKKHWPRPYFIKQEAAADYVAGMPVKDLCAKYATDLKTIHRWVKDAGVPLREGPKR